MQIFGIDISVWQKGINLTTAKNEGVKFVILRGGYTGSKNKALAKDSQFENHYKNAKANGLSVGAYWFSRACSYDEGVKEAIYFYNNCLKGKQFEYPVCIDVEDNVYQAKAGKENVTQAIIGFCETLENFGCYASIYANVYWFKNYINLDKLKDYDKWIASWGTTKPTIKGGLWQFGGETNKIRTNKVAGVTCDQNYSYKDYPSIMKKVGLNGFSKPIVTPPIVETPIVEPPKVEAPIVEKPIETPIIETPIIDIPPIIVLTPILDTLEETQTNTQEDIKEPIKEVKNTLLDNVVYIFRKILEIIKEVMKK